MAEIHAIEPFVRLIFTDGAVVTVALPATPVASEFSAQAGSVSEQMATQFATLVQYVRQHSAAELYTQAVSAGWVAPKPTSEQTDVAHAGDCDKA
jgi:hypothetical protein